MNTNMEMDGKRDSDTDVSSERKRLCRRQGKPRLFTKKEYFAVVLRYQARLFSTNGKVVSKFNTVWDDLSQELHGKKTPLAWYTYVSCNKDDVKSELQTGQLHEDIDAANGNRY